jgi:hypothetical protein
MLEEFGNLFFGPSAALTSPPRMSLLLTTASLYSTVVVHAFYAQNPLYHHVFLGIITLSSLLFCDALPDSTLLHMASPSPTECVGACGLCGRCLR